MGIYLGTNVLGGGGGKGSGINSYAPFKVGTTDNNPQGYIASTGVYTNPEDESVWLKTGNTLPNDGTYPNATLSNYTRKGNYFNTVTSQRFVTSDGTNLYTGGFSQTTPVQQRTLLGALTGTVYNLNALNDSPLDMTWDGTHWYLTDDDDSQRYVYKYDASFNYIQRYDIGSGKADWIAWTGTYFVIGHSGGTLRVFDSSFVAQAAEVTPTGGVFNGLLWDGTHLWGAFSNNNMRKYSITGTTITYTGISIGITLNPGMFGYDPTTKTLWAGDYSNVWAFSELIGDSTARTDSSGSGQPLFIKLK
jgi:hypothetical protein